MIMNLQFHNSITRALVYIFLVLLCCSGLTTIALSQNTPGTAPGIPAGSYPLSDVDTINYYTGRLNVSIPIYTVSGRGEAKFPFSIQLEQNNWVKKFLIDHNGNYLYYPERK